ncbi:MAG: hypothetical protein NTY77_06495 [Elusimicrobia bacterium]|nr:hypothetical protein [Elusimicrobiota bacterium]
MAMLFILLALVLVALPMGLFYLREYKTSTPRLQWPVLAPILKLEYLPDPPRMQGTRNGRKVTVDIYKTGVRVATVLARPSRLRIEIGPKDVVTARSGMLVPDPVVTGDHAFEERFLARCSDKDAGLQLFDPVLRQRLLAQSDVDILGQGAMVQWVVPAVKQPDPAEDLLDILIVIAEEMERFPAA